jgi:hypothetical protein
LLIVGRETITVFWPYNKEKKKIRIPRKGIILKFKESRPVGRPRSRGFSHLLEGIEKRRQR